MEIIQVSSTSPASAVARAISSVVHEYHCAEVQAIGTKAVNQAMQALILATGYLEHDGISLTFVRQRKRVTIGNKHQTLVRITIASSTASGLSSLSNLNAPKTTELPRV